MVNIDKNLDEDEEDEFFSSPGIDSPLPRTPYSREDYLNADDLRNTSLKPELLKTVEKMLIYEDAREQLRVLISNYFDAVWFLANLEAGHGSETKVNELLNAKFNLELDIAMMSSAFCRSDWKSPDVLAIINALRSHFDAIISRAKGKQRERILNTKTVQSIEQITRSESVQRKEKPKPKKGGWF